MSHRQMVAWAIVVIFGGGLASMLAWMVWQAPVILVMWFVCGSLAWAIREIRS